MGMIQGAGGHSFAAKSAIPVPLFTASTEGVREELSAAAAASEASRLHFQIFMSVHVKELRTFIEVEQLIAEIAPVSSVYAVMKRGMSFAYRV